MSRCCEKCEFWRLYHEGEGYSKGYCQRFPPTVICLGDEVDFIHPQRYDNDWCGEFKANETGDGNEKI